MTLLERIAGAWFAMLDASAQGAAALVARVSTLRRITALDGAAGDLVLLPDGRVDGPALGRLGPAGSALAPATAKLLRRSHVTIELDARGFVFRDVDLPGRASEFVEAIVRTQIDRLTPWPPEQALFGWTEPRAQGAQDKIVLTIAATAKAAVLPTIARLQAAGAAVVVARVRLPADLDAAPAGGEQTVVVARAAAAEFQHLFWRRALGAATLVVVALVIGASLYGQVAALQIAAATDDIQQRSAARRASIAGAAKAAGPASSAARSAAQRKHEAPFATLVLETVTRLLPDTTFVTGFELAGTRLRLVGFTEDAPALIRRFEQSTAVTGAAFFAPTTRGPDDPGDRFSIEATVRPSGDFSR